MARRRGGEGVAVDDDVAADEVVGTREHVVVGRPERAVGEGAQGLGLAVLADAGDGGRLGVGDGPQGAHLGDVAIKRGLVGPGRAVISGSLDDGCLGPPQAPAVARQSTSETGCRREGMPRAGRRAQDPLPACAGVRARPGRRLPRSGRRGGRRRRRRARRRFP